MDDDDEFEREAALDAEDAAWENSDDDAPEEAPNGSDDDDDDAPEEAGNAPRTVDEDGFSDEEPDAAANAAAVEYDEPARARRRTGALRRVEAAAAKRRKLAEPAADFVEVPAEPVVAAPPPIVERRTRVADNIFVSDERAHRSLFDARPSASVPARSQILRLLDGVAVAPSTHWFLRAQVGARTRAAQVRRRAARKHDGPRPVRDASAAGLRGPQAPAAEGQGEGGGGAGRGAQVQGAGPAQAQGRRRTRGEAERRGPKAAGAPQVQRGGPGAAAPQEQWR